ncbi:MAG: hypothetical protein HBSAPP03_09090 [Phycisphaerae bacterium]|nr:MAG: hypothetical protein HBSAPP03_09090 [Phycisphaerae bacterium]
MFKWPGIPVDRLLACYAAAKAEHWEVVNPMIRRFDRIKAALERYVTSGRVLDVGCFTGDFLAYLGPRWRPLGIEPGEAAAHRAKEQGIDILGATIDGLVRYGPSGENLVDQRAAELDAVVSLDVLEHLVDPASMFRRVSALLRRGGVFLAVTGDTDAVSWRLEGSLHWYCSLPEHVAFYNRTCMERAAARHGMKSVAHERMSHKTYPVGRCLGQWVKNIGYVAMNRVGGLGIPTFRRWFIERHAPIWTDIPDHMIHVMRKE